MDGSFDNFKDPATLLLNSSLSARDLQLIGALFDREWPAIGPVQLDSQIRKGAEGKQLNNTLTAGETRVESKLNAIFDTTPMRINGTIKAKKMLVYELFEKKGKARKRNLQRRSTYLAVSP